MEPGEIFAVTCGITAVLTVVVMTLIKWVRDAKPGPDPWGAETAKLIEESDPPPLCHRCLTPQEHDGWFCPHCGTAIGPYNNVMPYVYIFSEGEMLRAGVTERMRPSFRVVFGYLLVSLCLYSIFAPVFWVVLIKNLRNRGREVAARSAG